MDKDKTNYNAVYDAIEFVLRLPMLCFAFIRIDIYVAAKICYLKT